MQYLGQVFYITISQLLFYIAQTWWLIAITALVLLLLFSIGALGILKHTR